MKTLANGSCGLTDGSVAGDWRLPNIKELQSLMDYGQASHPVLPAGHPFSGVQSIVIFYDYYWSSTTDVDITRFAWSVDLNGGRVERSTKIPDVSGWLKRMWVWPVRDGR
jgi:hypothetical protein